MDDDRRANLSAMITPLRLIFWGGLVCLIDFTLSQKVNGSGFKFDLLDDFLGMLLITFGIFRLARFAPTASFSKGMAFVKVVAVVATFKALIDHWAFRTPEVWDMAWTVFSMVELAAIVVFCFSMNLLCRIHELEEAARSWKTTSMLFVVIYALPLGMFYVASLVSTMVGGSFNLNLGAAGLLLLLAFVIPIIHLFVSTSRMAREARGG